MSSKLPSKASISLAVITLLHVTQVNALTSRTQQSPVSRSTLFVRSESRPRNFDSPRQNRNRNRRPSWDMDNEIDDFMEDSSYSSPSRNPSFRETLSYYTPYKPEWEHRKQDPINCKHFGTCPGCTVDKEVTTVPAIQSAQLFFSSASIQRHTLQQQDDEDFFQIIVPSPVTEWRTQAKLAVAPKSKWGQDGCVFGLYERGTHSVLPIPECQVHHPNINRAVELLTEATAKVRTVSYDEHNGTGALRYVQLQVERFTGNICLTLVWNAELLKQCQPDLSRLVKELKRLDSGLWHSIWCHCNNGLGNNIFSRGDNRWHQIDGPEFIREPLPEIVLDDDYDDDENEPQQRKDGLLFFNPMSFRQGNIDGFNAIAEHVAKAVPPGSAVCELYAGVGVLGLTSLSYAYNNNNGNGLRWLRCSDENPSNPRCFNRAIDSMPTEVTGRSKRFMENKNKKGKKSKKTYTINSMVDNNSKGQRSRQKSNDQDSNKVTYMVASATKALFSGQALGADVLIVDPPRKGLDEEVVAQLCKPFNPNQPPIEDKRMLFGPSYTANMVNDVKTLIYVSCGFDALARDTDAILSSSAGWKLASATGYVLFPGSNHLETVAVFKREGRDTEDEY